jgi:hypothetical protein
MATTRLKVGAAIALILFVCVLLSFLLVPEHFLRRMNNWAVVTVDGRAVNADAYLGNPTFYESDAFVLVRIDGDGNYLFNFDGGTFREVSSYEFVPLHWGVFVFKPMSKGHWLTPLPSQGLNEFRVAVPNGHTLTVKF